MKYFILLFLLAFKPPVNRGYHKLTWRDFAGKCPEGDMVTVALIRTELHWGTGSEWNPEWNIPIDQDTVLWFNAFVRFDPDQSFSSTKDPYILKHEQGHLDICEIVSIKANKDGMRNTRMSKETWLSIQNSYIQSWNHLDSAYDAQTNHSQNKIAQEKWDKWINEQLK